MRINNYWYSLRNVRRIFKHDIQVRTRTHKGQKYPEYSGMISIDYFGGKCECIRFEEYTSKNILEKEMDKIFDELCAAMEKEDINTEIDNLVRDLYKKFDM